jgi:uncharacterized membrane protein YiaA
MVGRRWLALSGFLFFWLVYSIGSWVSCGSLSGRLAVVVVIGKRENAASFYRLHVHDEQVSCDSRLIKLQTK